jgi:uncharacterized protein YceK
MIYAIVIALLLVGCSSVDKIQTTKERYAGKRVYVYLFNQETQLWDRATAETLTKADCSMIRFLESPQE